MRVKIWGFDDGGTGTQGLRWATAALVAGLAVLFSTRYAPPFRPIGRDSGVFLTGGQMLLQGKLPYVDFWDHKPPLIYFFNAAGLALGAGRWGVWGVETALFAAASAVFFLALSRILGSLSALAGAGFLILASRNVFFFSSGNFTESYALSLNLLVLACAVRQPVRRWSWFVAGAAGAGVFFTKQSCIGTPLAVAIALSWLAVVWRRAAFGKHLLSYCAGAIAITAAIALWMTIASIWGEFWNANFVYGRMYVQLRYREIDALRRWWRIIWVYDARGLLQLSGFSAIVCGITLAARAGKSSRLLLPATVVLLALPIELWMTALPYRTYGHYYLGLFPLFGLALAMWLHQCRDFSRRLIPPAAERLVASSACLSLALLPAFVLSGPLSITEQKDVIADAVRPKVVLDDQNALRYLDRFKVAGPLLMWGAETRVNFQTGRSCPTRYFYMYPLTLPQYDHSARMAELLRDLREHPRSIIIDTLADSPNHLGPDRSPQRIRGVD
ncbi:MAG: hypothetical protein J7M14_01600, partial [Planctomycetes bacterium]|nr:hypothetical protein [Planctomycetota bacterium]